MITSFKDFMENVVIEELHPELKSIVTSSKPGKTSKQTQIANKIKDLSSRGERTGVEGDMPQGSSRAYMRHDEPTKVNIDGKASHLLVGTKVAIRSKLDKHHDHKEHDGLSLGAMQNRAEAGDHWVNSNYRILKHEGGNNFTSNKESGIFPPLLDHDHEHHQWSHVGHVGNVTTKGFKEATKTKEFPEGIHHKDFVAAMNRFHEANNGKYWKGNAEHEGHLNKIDQHPLVQKFQDYHGNTGHPTYDYHQIQNLGVWHHPDGSKHIIARDHGFDSDVAGAYQKARKTKNIPTIFR